MKGFIVEASYKIENNKPVIHLFGRLENNESFHATTKYKPYFYIKSIDLESAKKLLNLEYEDTDLKNFEKQNLTKVYVDIPSDISDVKKTFNASNIGNFEADIGFIQRYFIDNNICGTIDLNGNYEKEAIILVSYYIGINVLNALNIHYGWLENYPIERGIAMITKVFEIFFIGKKLYMILY